MPELHFLLYCGTAGTTPALFFFHYSLFILSLLGGNFHNLADHIADMVLDILESGNVPEYHVMDGGIITVNTETAAALGIDYAAFSTISAV